MAIIQKEITKAPEIKFFVEETGGYFDSEKRAQEALEEYLEKEEEKKIDAEISIKLFGATWVSKYGENWLVMPQFLKDYDWYEEGFVAGRKNRIEYEFNGNGHGIIDFKTQDGYERLFDKLISNGIILSFNSSDHSYFDKDIDKMYIGCGVKENKWGYKYNPKIENLRMAAFEYCKNHLN